MKCPKCGLDQPDDIFCANCGVDVNNYSKTKTAKNKNMKTIGAAVGAVVLILIVLLSIMGSDDSEPQRIDQALTATNAPIPTEEPPSTAAKAPGVEAPDSVTNDVPPVETKPVLPEKTKCSIEDPSDLVAVELRGIQADKNFLKAIRIKEGNIKEVVFQVDGGGYMFDNDPKIKDGHVLYLRGEDAGDMDDELAKKYELQDAYRIHVTGFAGGECWFYLYNMNRTNIPPNDKYIDFTENPESAYLEKYSVSFGSGSNSIFEKMELEGADVLDRFKIRLNTASASFDESEIDFESNQSTSGPLIARSQKKGMWVLGQNKVAVIRQATYFPEKMEMTFHFLFPPPSGEKQQMKMYFDFSETAHGMILKNPATAGEEIIDGTPNDKNAPTGNLLILAAKKKAIEIMLMGGNGQLFVNDDTSMPDAPENGTGCLGCAGFVMENLQGRQMFEFTFKYLTVSPENASEYIHPHPYSAGTLTKIR